jgi:hypothetical protein
VTEPAGETFDGGAGFARAAAANTSTSSPTVESSRQTLSSDKKKGPGGNMVSPRLIPAWVWLVGIVAVSIAVRVALARRMVAPWIMIDEIVYSELAKSFADSGEFLVRDVPSHGYGFVYPVLIAPAWRIFGPVPDAYAAAKWINGVVMSLAAIPAYFIAKRLLRPPLALAVAALTVAIPSMLYTGTLMTENAFYPLFLVAVLALVATLEQPTAWRQVLLLALIGLAYATRAQAVALVAAAATAPLLLALFERRGWRAGLRPFATLYAILAGGAVVAVLGTVVRGRSPLELLGAYRAATDSDYTVGGVLHFVLYHAAELDLYLGVLPFAALLALWLSPRDVTPAARAFAAASLAVIGWLLLEVAAFASQPSVNKIEERNLFYVAPLALIALVGLAADGVVTRRRRPLAIAAVVAGVLPVFVSFERFITTSAVADTLALLPWWWVQDHWIEMDQLRWAALAVGLAAGALFFWLPRRYALVLPGLVAAYFVLTAFVAENGRHGIHQASVGKRWSGIHNAHPDWLDRAVGRDASIAYLRTGAATDESLWENEFFNRSLGPVYATDRTRHPDPLPETAVERRTDGRLYDSNGNVVRAGYALVDGSTDVEGDVVATDPVGLRLVRTDGPLVLPVKVTGVYGDTWSGRTVTYRRLDCPGGKLTVHLGSDPALFTRNQVVTAYVGGRQVRRATIPPADAADLTVPLTQGADGACTVRFVVARTAVPGPGDKRRLGAHFASFTYAR